MLVLFHICLCVFRLICEKTVEENILKKADEKRLLGDIAIEGGNFNTAFFKKVRTRQNNAFFGTTIHYTPRYICLSD